MKTLQDIMNVNQGWQDMIKKTMHFTNFRLDDPVQMSLFVLSLLSASVKGEVLQVRTHSYSLGSARLSPSAHVPSPWNWNCLVCCRDCLVLPPVRCCCHL